MQNTSNVEKVESVRIADNKNNRNVMKYGEVDQIGNFLYNSTGLE